MKKKVEELESLQEIFKNRLARNRHTKTVSNPILSSIWGGGGAGPI
jgi:hypothetical protein